MTATTRNRRFYKERKRKEHAKMLVSDLVLDKLQNFHTDMDHLVLRIQNNHKSLSHKLIIWALIHPDEFGATSVRHGQRKSAIMEVIRAYQSVLDGKKVSKKHFDFVRLKAREAGADAAGEPSLFGILKHSAIDRNTIMAKISELLLIESGNGV